MERRGNRTYLTAFGETKHLAAWIRDPRCPLTDVSTLSSRVRDQGMDDQTAITTPLPDSIELTYQGETKSLAAWLEDDRCTAKARSTLHARIAKGWPTEEVLTAPIKPTRPSRHQLHITAWGETKTVSEWVDDKRCKVDATTLYRRIKRTEFSPEQVMATPPGRLTEVVTAWGESMTPSQWEADPRCRVKSSTLMTRLRSGWIPEEAIRTPSLRDGEMTIDQRFEAEISAMTAMGKTNKKERFALISRTLLTDAADAVKGEVQISNKYLVGKRFCMGIWAEPVTMLDFVAELVHLAETNQGERPMPVRRFLTALSDRQSQGSGDLYLFAGWFCTGPDGDVWRG